MIATSEKPLSVAIHRDVILAPFEGADELRFGFRLGAFTTRGVPIEDFRLIRSRGLSEEPAFRRPERSLDEPVRYGGVIIDHFGHFLLETLARSWWLRGNDTRPILWHSARPTLLPWQIDLFELLGIAWRRFIFVSEPLHVREIAVAEPGFAMGLRFHPTHAEALAVWPFSAVSPGKRVWLSRSGLPSGQGNVINGEQVEQALAQAGWHIMRPETMPIREQLAVMEQAEKIGGFQGSAFHLLALARNCRAELRVVARHPLIGRIFHLIAAAKQLRQQILVPHLNIISGAASAACCELADPQQVLRYLLG